MLTFKGMMRVTAAHTEDMPQVGSVAHAGFHQAGVHDSTVLTIERAGMFAMPTGRRGIKFQEFVQVRLSDEGVLTITETKPHPLAPVRHDGRTSVGWFDVLVGIELAMHRIRVAADACRALDRNPEDPSRAHPVEIAPITLDRIADQLMAYEIEHGMRCAL